MALITFLSLFNFSDYDTVEFEIPFMDKAVHFCFYFVANILGCLFIRERWRGEIPMRRTLIVMAFFLVLFGLIIEVIQSVYTLNRSGEIMDIIANMAGILISSVFISFLFSSKRGLKWKY